MKHYSSAGIRSVCCFGPTQGFSPFKGSYVWPVLLVQGQRDVDTTGKGFQMGLPSTADEISPSFFFSNQK